MLRRSPQHGSSPILNFCRPQLVIMNRIPVTAGETTEERTVRNFTDKKPFVCLLMLLAVVIGTAAGCASGDQPSTEGQLQRFSSYEELKDFVARRKAEGGAPTDF